MTPVFFLLRRANPRCLPPGDPMVHSGRREAPLRLGLLLRREGRNQRSSSPQWESECVKNRAWDEVDVASG